MNNNRLKTPKDHFYQIPSKDWSTITIFNSYLDAYKGQSLEEVRDILMLDLQQAVQTKRGLPPCSTITAEFDALFNTMKQRDGQRSQQQQPQPQQQPQQQPEQFASKIAYNWNSHGKIVQNFKTVKKTTVKRKNEDRVDDGSILHEIAKKRFSFFPPTMSPSISTNKPRVTSEEIKKLTPLYLIKINDEVDITMPKEVNDQYDLNMQEQASIHCFNKLPASFEFLKLALNRDLSDLPRWVWTNGYDDSHTQNDDLMIQMIRLILTDFYANCSKPPPSLKNERTPYIDYVIPVFKYFCATTKLMSFLWCEKGLASNKLLAICMPDDSTRKLLDGIGMTAEDGLERALIESSGESDDGHSTEDTVKLMECGAKCLREEMNQYRQASFITFLKRRVFCVQYIGNKLSLLSVRILSEEQWTCISERSSIIPRNYEQRQYWLPVFELLAKLKELLGEQNLLTKELVNEHTGWSKVEVKDQIRNKISQ